MAGSLLCRLQPTGHQAARGLGQGLGLGAGVRLGAGPALGLSRSWGRDCSSSCAVTLQPIQQNIALGLSNRLASVSEQQQAASEGQGRGGPASASAPARVAVVGRHSVEFAAALRAVRAAGAVAVPVDAQRWDKEDLVERFAEAQVQFAVTAGTAAAGVAAGGGAAPVPEHVREAARLLAVPLASAGRLQLEALQHAQRHEVLLEHEQPPLLLLTTAVDYTHVPRAAQVPHKALSARIAAAVRCWGLDDKDTVLSLGLAAEEPAAVVDALEAPLAVGAKVAMADIGQSRGRSQGKGSVTNVCWDLWAALLATRSATVVLLPADKCRPLLDAYAQLAPQVRAELADRWAAKPLRHIVAVASRGTTTPPELSESFAEIFKCPLTWHFSSAEAGPLLTVTSHQEGRCSHGGSWRVEGDELWVAGDSVFEQYHGRPRSTEAAFSADDGFLRTFQRVQPGSLAQDTLLPLPAFVDETLVNATENAIHKGPEPSSATYMRPDWRVRKLPMRVYETWRTAWGGTDVTKKHCTVHKVYKPKYKKRRKV